jgi:hypothetical protein
LRITYLSQQITTITVRLTILDISRTKSERTAANRQPTSIPGQRLEVALCAMSRPILAQRPKAYLQTRTPFTQTQ